MTQQTSAPQSDASLVELLAERARNASDGRLVLDAIGGIIAAAIAAFWAGPGSHFLMGAAICLASFGAWGIVDRELRERAQLPGRFRAPLRALKWAVALTGFASAAFLILAALALILGRMIS